MQLHNLVLIIATILAGSTSHVAAAVVSMEQQSKHHDGSKRGLSITPKRTTTMTTMSSHLDSETQLASPQARDVDGVDDFYREIGRLSSSTQCFPEARLMDEGDTDLTIQDLRSWAYRIKHGEQHFQHGEIEGFVCTTRADLTYDLRHVERAVYEMDLLCGPYVSSQFNYLDLNLVVAKGTGTHKPSRNCKDLQVAKLDLDFR
ncbi:uncharacterized protein B0I36DRAFT_330048 [Microdochium trichocladiopsis]|uniref:Uncharacterized protein n=1 Tax=Microdochium trichocladiopsis TaxID=1682393 RepID=A0A9P9BMD8_9PEZI|nr:uncharacterized protein B0I36DRAFT_330048 [Microdochium trichocladiopsis]KAH7026173.1 hypothetical protein B0I36DRAFT_330048 [Microdochium trichocladiopsis]